MADPIVPNSTNDATNTPLVANQNSSVETAQLAPINVDPKKVQALSEMFSGKKDTRLQTSSPFSGSGINNQARHEFADLPDFLEYTSALNLDMGRHVAELARGDNQAGGERAFNGVAHIASTFITDMSAFAGEIFYAAMPTTYMPYNPWMPAFQGTNPNASTLDRIVNNPVSKGLRDFNDWVTEVTPVFTTTADMSNDTVLKQMSSSTFWANDGAAGIGYFFSSLVPSMLLEGVSGGLATPIVAAKFAQFAAMVGKFGSDAKHISSMMKAYRFGKNVSRATTFTGQVFLQTAQEAFTEAAVTSNEIEKVLLERMENGEVDPDTGELYTVESIQAAKNEALRRMTGSNMAILIGSNMLETAFMFGKKGPSKSAYKTAEKLAALTKRQRLYKSLLKKTTSTLGTAGSEAFLEEGPQTTLENVVKNDILNGGTALPEAMRLLDNYIEGAITDQETQKAMLLGGLLGAGGGIYGGIRHGVHEKKLYDGLTKGRLEMQKSFKDYSTQIYKTDASGNIILDSASNKPIKDFEKIKKNLESATNNMERALILDSLLAADKVEAFTMEYVKDFAAYALNYMGHDAGFYAFMDEIDGMDTTIKEQFIEGAMLSNDEFRLLMKDMAEVVKKTWESVSGAMDVFVPMNVDAKSIIGYEEKHLENDAKEYQIILAKSAAIHAGVEYVAKRLQEQLESGENSDKIENKADKIKVFSEYENKAKEALKFVFSKSERNKDFEVFLNAKVRERVDMADLIDRLAKESISKTLEPALAGMIHSYTYVEAIHDPMAKKDYQVQHSAVLEVNGIPLNNNTVNRWLIAPRTKSNEITLVNEKTGETIAIKSDMTLIYDGKRIPNIWSLNQLESAKDQAKKLKTSAYIEALNATATFFKDRLQSINTNRAEILKDIKKHEQYLKMTKAEDKRNARQIIINDLNEALASLNEVEQQGNQFLDRINELGGKIDIADTGQLDVILEALRATDNLIQNTLRLKAQLQMQLSEFKKVNDTSGIRDMNKQIADVIETENKVYNELFATKQLIYEYINSIGKHINDKFFGIRSYESDTTPSMDGYTDDGLTGLAKDNESDLVFSNRALFNDWTSFLKTALNEEAINAENDAQRLATMDFVSNGDINGVTVEVISFQQAKELAKKESAAGIPDNDNILFWLRFFSPTTNGLITEPEAVAKGVEGELENDVKIVFKRNGKYLKHKGSFVYASLPTANYESSNSESYQRFRNIKLLTEEQKQAGLEGYNLFRELAKTHIISMTISNRTGGYLKNGSITLQQNNSIIGTIFQSKDELTKALDKGVDSVIHTVSATTTNTGNKVDTVADGISFVGRNGLSYIKVQGRWMVLKNQMLSESDIELIQKVLVEAYTSRDPLLIDKVDSWLNNIIHTTAENVEGKYAFRIAGRIQTDAITGAKTKVVAYALTLGEEVVYTKDLAEGNAEAIKIFKDFMRTKRYNINTHQNAHAKFQYPVLQSDNTVIWEQANNTKDYYAHMLSTDKFMVGLQPISSGEPNFLNVGLQFALKPSDLNAVNSQMKKVAAPVITPTASTAPTGSTTPTATGFVASNVESWKSVTNKVLGSTENLEVGKYYSITGTVKYGNRYSIIAQYDGTTLNIISHQIIHTTNAAPKSTGYIATTTAVMSIFKNALAGIIDLNKLSNTVGTALKSTNSSVVLVEPVMKASAAPVVTPAAPVVQNSEIDAETLSEEEFAEALFPFFNAERGQGGKTVLNVGNGIEFTTETNLVPFAVTSKGITKYPSISAGTSQIEGVLPDGSKISWKWKDLKSTLNSIVLYNPDGSVKKKWERKQTTASAAPAAPIGISEGTTMVTTMKVGPLTLDANLIYHQGKWVAHAGYDGKLDGLDSKELNRAKSINAALDGLYKAGKIDKTTSDPNAVFANAPSVTITSFAAPMSAFNAATDTSTKTDEQWKAEYEEVVKFYAANGRQALPFAQWLDMKKNPPFEVWSPYDTATAMPLNQGLEWYVSKFPEMSIETIENGLVEGIGAAKLASSKILMVSSLAAGDTLFHEAFHTANLVYNTNAQRKALYNELRTRLGDKVVKVSMVTDGTSEIISVKGSELTDRMAEEFLATEFKEYMLSNGSYSFPEGIPIQRSFFQRLWDGIKSFFNFNGRSNLKNIEDYFNYVATTPSFVGQGEVWMPSDMFEVADLTGTDAALYNANFSFHFFNKLTGDSLSTIQGVSFGTKHLLNFTPQIQDDIYLQLGEDLKPATMLFAEWTPIFKQLVDNHRKLLGKINLSSSKEELDLLNKAHTTVDDVDMSVGRTMADRIYDVSTSEVDKMDKALRLFLMAVPVMASDGRTMVKTNINVNGHSTMATQVANFRMLSHQLHNTLHDITEENILNVLSENSGVIPGVEYIIARLGLQSGTNVDKYLTVLRAAFYKQFLKTKSDPKILTYDDTSQTMEFNSPLFVAFKDKIKSSWYNNITSGSSLFENGTMDANKTTFKFSSGTSKVISTISMSDFKSSQDKYRFLEGLGLNVSDFIKDFAPTYAFNKAVDEMLLRFFENTQAVAKANNGLINGKDLFNPEMFKMQDKISNLVAQILLHTPSSDELSYKDAENKNRYSIGEHTYLTNLTAAIRSAAKLETADERRQALLELGVAPYQNGRGSLMLTNSMFIDLIETGYIPNNHLEIITIESITDSDENKRGFAKFSSTDLQISYINNVLSGYMPVARTGSRKVENYIVNGQFKMADMTQAFYMKSMLEFFYSEVSRTWALKYMGVGKDLKNYAKNAQTLFSFEDVLGQEGFDELNVFMESGAGRKTDIVFSVKEFFENSDSTRYYDAIKNSIHTTLNDSMNQAKNEMIEAGILSGNREEGWLVQGVDVNILQAIFPRTLVVASDGVKISHEELQLLVGKFIMNWDVGIELTTRIMVNDPAHLKNAGEVFKRFSGGNSTKSVMSNSAIANQLFEKHYPRIDGRAYNDTATVKVFSDEMVQITPETLVGISQELASFYKSGLNEASDAQALMNPDFGRAILLKSGQWMDSHETTYQYEMQKYYIQKLKELETKKNSKREADRVRAMFTSGVFSEHTNKVVPAKPMFDNKEIDTKKLRPINTLKVQNFGRSVQMSAFNSEQLISPLDFTKNSQSWNWPSQNPILYEQMAKNQIDYITFPTGKKGDTLSDLQPLIDKDGNMISEFDNKGVYEESLFNYGIQVATPYKNKDAVTLSTQLNRLLFNNLIGSDSKLTPARQRMVKKLFDEYNQLLATSTIRAMEDLMIRLGVTINADDTVVLTDKANFAERVQKLSESGYISRDMTDNINQIMNSSTPFIELSPMASTIESNLMAIISKEAIQHKVLGRMLIQESDSIHKVTNDKKLKFYRKGIDSKGQPITLPMQVRMALTKSAYAYVIDKYGSLEALNALLLSNPSEVEEELRLVTGNRIPSDDVHSIEFMEVVEFFPPWHGDSLVLPAEVVIKSGTDFDVDKMTTYMDSLFDPYYDTKNDEQRKLLVDNIGTKPNEVARFLNYIQFNYRSYDIISKLRDNGFNTSEAIFDQIDEYVTDIIALQEELYENRKGLQESDVFQETLAELWELKDLRSTMPKRSEERKLINQEIAKIHDTLNHGIVDSDTGMSRTEMNARMQSLINSRSEFINRLKTVIDNAIVDLNIQPHEVNSQLAVQTRMNQLRKEVLGLSESFDNLLQPTSTEPIKKVATAMIDLYGGINIDNQDSKNTLKFTNVLNVANKMLGAQASLGIVATSLVNHSTMRQYPINTTEFVKIPIVSKQYNMANNVTYSLGTTDETNKLVSLGNGIYRQEKISQVLNQLLNSFLDAEKDPFIADTGVNLETLAVTNLLLRIAPNGKLAMPFIDIAKLLNLPIIKKRTALMRGSVIKAKLNIAQSTEELIPGLKYRDSLAGMYRAFQKVTDNRDRAKLLAKFNAKLGSIPPINISELNDYKNISEARELEILELYLYLEVIAGELTNITVNTRFDSAIPNTRNMVEVSLMNTERAIDRTTGFNPKDISNFINNSYLNSYQKVYQLSNRFLKPFFLSEHDSVASIMDDARRRISEEYSSKEKKARYLHTFQSNLVGHILASTPVDGASIFDEIASLVIGDSSVAKELLVLKNSGLLNDNLFFDELVSSIDKFNRSVGHGEGYDYISTYSRRITPDDLEIIKQDYVQALTTIPELANFGERLIKLAIAQTGMQGKRGSYNSLIPATEFFEITQARAAAFLTMSDINQSEIANEFLENFYLNKWYDTTIVPRIAAYTGKGIMRESLFKNGDYSTFSSWRNHGPYVTIKIPTVSKEEANKLRKKKITVPSEVLMYNRVSSERYNYTYELVDKKGAPMIYEGLRQNTVIPYNKTEKQLELINATLTEEEKVERNVSDMTLSKEESDRITPKKEFGVIISKSPINDNKQGYLLISARLATGATFTLKHKVLSSGPLAKFSDLNEIEQKLTINQLGYADIDALKIANIPAEMAWVQGESDSTYIARIQHQYYSNSNSNPKPKSNVKVDSAKLTKVGLNEKLLRSLYPDTIATLKIKLISENNFSTKDKIVISAFNTYLNDIRGIIGGAYEYLNQTNEDIITDFIQTRISDESIEEFINRKAC